MSEIDTVPPLIIFVVSLKIIYDFKIFIILKV